MIRPTTKWAAALALVACTTGGLWGCVGGSKSAPQKEDDRLKAYISDTVPGEISEKTDINFENKVHLIGYRVEPKDRAVPGSEVKLTMFWRCDEKLEDGWLLFTHVLDSNGERILNIDNVGPLRDFKDNKQAFPPSSWQKGKFYIDEQSFRVPDDVKTADISVVTGVWKGDARLKIVSGPGDPENRGIVVRLKTGSDAKPAAKPEVPKLAVTKLGKTDKIKVDGKLDDDAWKKAAITGPFVDVGSGKPNTTFPVNASARVTWDDENLYLGVQVQDSDVVGGFPKDAKDPHLWTKDTVEVMVDPDGDGDNNDYYEIQVNPQNLVFDTQYDGYNTPKTEPDGPFGHQDWSSKVKSAVVVDGTIDKADDKDKGYTVEMAIPWSSFTKAKVHPPKPGDTWRLNLYAMQNNSGVAWSPILGEGNFHKASRFGRVTWADGAALAAATPSASAANVRLAASVVAPPGVSAPLPKAPVAPAKPPSAPAPANK